MDYRNEKINMDYRNKNSYNKVSSTILYQFF